MGTIEPILNLTSSSKGRGTAVGWANDISAADRASGRDISVLSVYSGTGGRDISSLSLVQGEGEVLILPGGDIRRDIRQRGHRRGVRVPRISQVIKTSKAKKWYIVHFKPDKTSRPWQAGSKASDLPSSTPNDEYLGKIGSPFTVGIGGRTGKGSAPRR